MICCSWLVAEAGSGATPVFSASRPRWTSRVASPPSSRIMLANLPPGQIRICWVHHQYSSSDSPFQAKTGTPARGVDGALGADRDGGGRVVLGGEDVAGGPADLGAERDQRLDEDRGLDRHVQRAGDARAGERLLGAVALPHRHQAGHLVLGELDLGATEVGEGEVGDLEVHGSDPYASRAARNAIRLSPRITIRRILEAGPPRSISAPRRPSCGTAARASRRPPRSPRRRR